MIEVQIKESFANGYPSTGEESFKMAVKGIELFTYELLSLLLQLIFFLTCLFVKISLKLLGLDYVLVRQIQAYFCWLVLQKGKPDPFGFFFTLNCELFLCHHHGEVWEEHFFERLKVQRAISSRKNFFPQKKSNNVFLRMAEPLHKRNLP